MGSVSALGAWVRAGLVVLVVLVLDQLSKHLVRQSIVPGEERNVLPGIQLVNTRNHGVALHGVRLRLPDFRLRGSDVVHKVPAHNAQAVVVVAAKFHGSLLGAGRTNYPAASA